MGCPDWPKCFGAYVPPNSSEALPENYQEVYKEQRIAKNERLSNVLNSLGYEKLSEKITNDPAVQVEHEFDVTKAWVEYVNRLVGVLIGFLVILNMIFSFSYRQKSVWIPTMGILIFLLTVFQGWIGSLVVSTNLLHGFITFHMLLALLMVAMLIWMNVRIRELGIYRHKWLFIIGIATTILFIPQIILGTEVRGVIDDLLVSTVSRGEWADFLSTSFFVHRSYSWLILIGAVMLFYFARKTNEPWLINTSMRLVILVFAAMVAGIIMVKGGFPVWLQPLHLILAVGIFSLLFYLTLRLRLEK